MRTKSLQMPTGVEAGHEWLSPDGHSVTWHRKFDGFAWNDVEAQETEEEEDLDDDDGTEEEDDTTTEETKGERSNETTVSDRDGQQGADGSPKQPAARKQGKGGKSRRSK